jgi:hypothetical protein
MNPITLLREAIKAVPAVKWALGMAGIAAVVEIVLGTKKLGPQVAVIGALIVIGLMFLLVVFSRFAGRQNVGLLGPAVVLVWFYTVAAIATTVLLFTSHFLDWPRLRATIRTQPIELSGIANCPLNWLLNPPVGQTLLGNIKYKILTGNTAVACTYALFQPNMPRDITIPLNGLTGVREVHMLVDGDYSELSPGGQVGFVGLRYTDDFEQDVMLIVNQTIAETWSYDDAGVGASKLTPPAGVQWAVAWSEAQPRCDNSGKCRNAHGFLHSLSIETARAKGLKSIQIHDSSQKAGINLTALTLEVAE